MMNTVSTQERYPTGHPLAGKFKPTGKVQARRLRSILRSALLSTDPEVHAILDEFRAVNPDATRRRRVDGEPVAAENLIALEADGIDTVLSFGAVLQRRREGVLPSDDFSMIRFQFAAPITDEEIVHALQLIGYAWRQHLSGEPLEKAERDNPNSFVVWADATKSRRTNVDVAISEFEESLPTILKEGSPVRTSSRIDRSTGRPMAGTRLVEGLGREDSFEVFYDRVVSE